MQNKDTSFFYGLSIATIGLLLIVGLITVLTIISGATTLDKTKSPYQTPSYTAQELLFQKEAQEKAASELGFASRHKIETVYPKGWESPKSTDSNQTSDKDKKGFFSTESKLVTGEKNILSPKNISFLFGIITIILTVFTISALSMPFISTIEEKRGTN
jgi:hypothetical protein